MEHIKVDSTFTTSSIIIKTHNDGLTTNILTCIFLVYELVKTSNINLKPPKSMTFLRSEPTNFYLFNFIGGVIFLYWIIFSYVLCLIGCKEEKLEILPKFR